MTSPDIHFMHHALNLARRGLGRTWPNPSVGCVIVKNKIVIGTGRTADGGRPHAETEALKMAGRDAKGATVYVTLEPCAHHGQTPPCAAALMVAEVARVVIACGDPDPRVSGEGIRMLKAAGIHVDLGILEKEAQELNAGFFLKTAAHRPFVTLKIATTADEKIALKDGKQKWITGQAALKRVHLERALNDAILVGIDTVIADNPRLTTRLPGHEHRIMRIVLDSDLRLPVESHLVQSAEKDVWVFYRNDKNGRKAALERAGVRCIQIDPRDLKAVMTNMAEEGLTRLMVEGGGKVLSTFLEAGLADRFLWFKSPENLGAEGLEALSGRKIGPSLADLGLTPLENSAFGQDLLVIYGRSA